MLDVEDTLREITRLVNRLDRLAANGRRVASCSDGRLLAAKAENAVRTLRVHVNDLVGEFGSSPLPRREKSIP